MNNTTSCAPFQLEGCGPTFGFSNSLRVGRAWGENQGVGDPQGASWNESTRFISLPYFSLFDLQLTCWGQVYLRRPCQQCSIMPPPFGARPNCWRCSITPPPPGAYPNTPWPQLRRRYGATSTGRSEPTPPRCPSCPGSSFTSPAASHAPTPQHHAPGLYWSTAFWPCQRSTPSSLNHSSSLQCQIIEGWHGLHR